ncbi:MAG: ribosomal RNA small subunit methyltransferase A [Planctomycetota bacterium]|nr:MAG: ribosomal RNA small subunit methyltransferase A [Planctomycetota bacterium]
MQTKTEIKAILADAGISPLKRFGQHFMIDGNLMSKLVVSANIRKNDVVLEIGPGTGSLTERLLEVAGRVIAIEIDNTLYAICRQRFGEHKNLTLIHGDILKSKSTIHPDVLQQLSEQRHHLGGRILMVANLPYQTATPTIIDLLMGDLFVSQMCFTVQAEVAERILSSPGGKSYGPISIFTQALAKVEKIARVPPEAFWPKPKIYSMMLKLEQLPEKNIPVPVRRQLTKVVHQCFNHRRKTMKSSLQKISDESTCQRLNESAKWNLTDRPEQLTVEQWIELAKCFCS